MRRYPRAAFFGFAFPAPEGIENATIVPRSARWDTDLKEYVLDWDDVRVAPDPHRTAVDFGMSVIRHACMVCGWDPELAASALGDPRPCIDHIWGGSNVRSTNPTHEQTSP